MAKSTTKRTTKRRPDKAGRAFRKAWKLLGRLERRLGIARAEEHKRIGQLGDGTGPEAVRRTAQLEAARAEIAQVEGLLSELSELIAANARAQSGQTVKDLANDAAASVREEAVSATATPRAAAAPVAPAAPVARTRRTRKAISAPPADSKARPEGA
jgi:hypothetical protein